MKFTISTLEEPFAFFEDYIKSGAIRKHLDEYVENWIKLELSDPVRYKVFSTDDYCDVIEKYPTFIIPEDGSDEERVEFDQVIEYSFAETSEDLLKQEVLISKGLIKEIILEYLRKFNDSSNILFFHAKSLKELFDGSEYILTKFPFCIDHLNTLSQYIQDSSNNISNANNVHDPKSESTKSNDELENRKDDPIANILGYLKEEDENGIQIFNENDYTNLLQLLQILIDSKRCPDFENRFYFTIPVGLLKYTFYLILPYVNKDENGSKDYYFHFLLKAFPRFGKEWSFKSFKTKISTIPDVLPDYLPSIFREKRQQQIDKRK